MFFSKQIDFDWGGRASSYLCILLLLGSQFTLCLFSAKGQTIPVPSSDKYYRFTNNHPSDATPSWGDASWATGGLAHDDVNFYIGATSRNKFTGKTNNKNWQIWRWPASQDLDQDLDYGQQGVITFNLELSTNTTSYFRTYGHIGDIDCFLYDKIYYLAIPLTSSEENHRPIVAFFRAKDLEYINYSYLDKRYQTDVGWCAVKPNTLELYTSQDDADSILKYTIDWEKVKNKKDHDALSITSFHKIEMLSNVQGGEFTADGKALYISSGVFDCFLKPKSYDSDGIHVFNASNFKVIQRSTNPDRKEDGSFNFSFDNQSLLNQCYQEEPEGLTIWDMDKVPGHHPAAKGQLHVLLDDHNPYVPFGSSSTLSIRHFSRSKAVNDECSEAIAISACEKIVTDNYYARSSAGSPPVKGYTGFIEDVWYKIIPQTGSSFSIETYQVPGGLNNTVIQLFTGSCGNLKELKSDDNSGDGNHAKITISNYTGSGAAYVRITDYDGDNYGKFGIYYKIVTPGSGIYKSIDFLSGEKPSILKYPALTGDVNGDGRTDLIFTPQDWNGNTNLNVRVKLSKGDGTYETHNQVLGDGNGIHDFPTLTGDINGDKKTDLIFIGQDWEGNSNLNVRVKISNGDGTFTGYSQLLGDGKGVHDYPALTGDVNGDGKTDLIFVGQDWGGNTNLNVRVKMSNGDGTFSSFSQALGDGSGVHDYPTLTGDVNGDGKTDLIFVGKSWTTCGLNIRVKLSNGDGTWCEDWQAPADGAPLLDYPVLTGDVNKDGRTDLIFVFNNSLDELEIRTKITEDNYHCSSETRTPPALAPSFPNTTMLSTDYQVFPNPTRSYFQIKTANPERLRVTLINSYGTVLHNYSIGNSHTDRIDFSQIQTGVYFIEIFNDRTGERTTRTVIKNSD